MSIENQDNRNAEKGEIDECHKRLMIQQRESYSVYYAGSLYSQNHTQWNPNDNNFV